VTFAPKQLNEDSSSTNDRCGQWVWGWRRGDDTRFPCCLSEREALGWMADRLRRIAAFE
jgi:hypothetical protein